MRTIACIGSGLASRVFALAVNGRSKTSAVTLFRRDAFGPDDTAGLALSNHPRRKLQARLEAVLGSPLPLRRWQRAEVIQRDTITSIAGELGAAASQADLVSMLAKAAIANECAERDSGAAAIARELAAFDYIVVEDTAVAANDAVFAFDAMPHRALGVQLKIKRLAADRVLQVVERGTSVFYGHGFAVDDEAATFFVEATEQAWSRQGLLDAPSDALAAFIAEAFSRALDGAEFAFCHGLLPMSSALARRWRAQNRILLGGSAKAAHRSFLYRTELALDDALALAAAFAEEGPIDQALERYEKSRRTVAASAARASELEIDWLENLHRIVDLPAKTFAFNALTRSLRINHRDLQRAAPAFVQAVDREFAGIAEGSNQAAPPPMFVPYTLRGLTLDNRIVVSPMCMYHADDGAVGDFQLVHLGSRAIGGAGLIITEMTNVAPEGRITPGCAGLYKPEHVGAWRRIVDYVHTHTPAKIGIQLAHAGRRASTALPWQGRNIPPPDGGWETLAPSAISFCDTLPAPREMSHADMARLVADFDRAAHWSDAAGFDLIELHMAHGYLLSTFLSPLSNKRRDAFGGDLNGRARFPLQVVEAVRAACPAKPLSVRISAVDWSPGGSTIEEMIEFSAMLKEAGVDIVDVSTGNVIATRRPTTGRLFQTPFSDQIRNEVKIPTMTVGQIKSYGDINAILAAGRADLCLLAKGSLRQPYFAYDAAEAQGFDLPWPKAYAQAKDFSLRDED